MSEAILMIIINITSFVLISQLEKDHSMTETHRLKKCYFYQTIIGYYTVFHGLIPILRWLQFLSIFPKKDIA